MYNELLAAVLIIVQYKSVYNSSASDLILICNMIIRCSIEILIKFFDTIKKPNSIFHFEKREKSTQVNGTVSGIKPSIYLLKLANII